jgi:hypothetical protein
MDNSHSIKQDKIKTEYRINIFSLRTSTLLAQTSFSDNKEAVIFLTDLLNTESTRNNIRAQVETKATGYAHVG